MATLVTQKTLNLQSSSNYYTQNNAKPYKDLAVKNSRRNKIPYTTNNYTWSTAQYEYNTIP